MLNVHHRPGLWTDFRKAEDMFYPSVFSFLHWHNQSCSSRSAGQWDCDDHLICSPAHGSPSVFPRNALIQPNTMQFSDSTLLGKTAKPDLQLQVIEIPSHPRVTCSHNEL